MNILTVIPARMGSTRFPGKPMALINGIPMIGHVYYRASMCQSVQQTYVATCDIEIFDYIISIGGNAVMTKDTHERCSDRTAEALLKIEKIHSTKFDVVCMVQGDEPLVTPSMIEKSIAPLKDPSIYITNLMAPILSIEDFEDPNEVKVVVDRELNALYFSREPIPSRKKGCSTPPMFKQVCIIPFRREFLIEFNELEETSLEKVESVDMMRILENGKKVRMVLIQDQTVSVDTEEDLRIASQMLEYDEIVTKYQV